MIAAAPLAPERRALLMIGAQMSAPARPSAASTPVLSSTSIGGLLLEAA